MDHDSLDWIWNDDDDDDDDDDYGLNDGTDEDESDSGGSGSDYSCSLTIKDPEVARDVKEIIDEFNREYAEGDVDEADDERPGDGEDDDNDEESAAVDRFYVDALEAATTLLSEVQLVWADTLQKCTVNEKNVPESYVKTTNIERLILLHASNFIEQFKVKYPNRRQLALVLENECGIQKCICTSIKPSRLVYHDLNNVLSYSEFVANHITYTKLDDAKIVPSKIVSPAMTLETQTANCFELATLLVSFLISCGYNAFVVQGYATEDVCNNDLRKVMLDLPPTSFKRESEFESEDLYVLDDTYAIEPVNDLCSNIFFQFLIEEEKKKNVVQNYVKENNSMYTSDPLYGQRVHSWVIVIPLKTDDVEHTDMNAYFIEPSTGQRKEISCENYIGIEAIWNHKNYWVNIQPLDGGCTQYNFSFMDATCWECFLPPSDISHDKNDTTRHLVVMPNSWVNVLEVPRNKYFMLYPTGKKIVLYMNALKESYGDYIMPDGLVEKTTYYQKPDYVNKMFVKEIYKHRIDKLICVEIKYTDDEIETTEIFSYGRDDSLKIHVFYGDRNSILTKRLVSFYDSRYDSMIELEIDENSFTTTFIDRSDLLFWRTCLFQKMENSNSELVPINTKRKLSNIIEKYLRDETKHKDRDIATRTFNLLSNNIFVQYQYGEGQITQSSRLFKKPSPNSEFDPKSVIENIVYPYVGHLKPHEAYLSLLDMMKAENEALRDVSKLEDDVMEILETRCRELSEFKLEINSLDWDRNHKIKKSLQAKKDEKLALAKQDKEKKIDYALPFLKIMKRPFTIETALKVRDKVTNNFRRSSKYQFKRAKSLFTKKQSKFKSATIALEADNFKDLELKRKAIMLHSSLKYELDVLKLKMERYKETRIIRYNHMASYLNMCPDFKMLPPLKLVDLRAN